MFGVRSKKPDKWTLTELWQANVGDYVIDLGWSPDGRQLAAVTVGGQVLLLPAARPRSTPQPLGAHGFGATSLSWRHDGAELATAGQDGMVKRWDATAGVLRQDLAAGSAWVAKAVYRPGGEELAAAAGKLLRVWSAAGQVVYESADHASTIADIGWSPSGKELALAAYNGVTVHAPDAVTPPRKYPWKGSSLVLAWSPTAKFIATGEQDSTVHFWHVESGEDAQMWGFPTKVLELAWHHSGNCLATGGSDTVMLWDCSEPGPEGREPRALEGHATKLTQLAFQGDGDLLASADADGFVLLWCPPTSSAPLAQQMLRSAVSRLCWSPDDRLLAAGEEDGTITVWEVR